MSHAERDNKANDLPFLAEEGTGLTRVARSILVTEAAAGKGEGAGNWCLHLVSACLLATMGGEALAQVASDAAGADYSLGEIVVTAQKRSESLQKVPVSVTALSESMLSVAKLDNAAAMVELVPGLHVNGVTGGSAPLYSLRGVSMYDYSLNQSSPVATYYDEVFKGNLTLQGVELYDLERVEVLEGPQGTLYGKNTTGGAINFIAKKPEFKTEGYLKAGVGNYQRKDAQAAIGGGIIDGVLAGRVAATYTKTDGWFKNVLPGHPNLENTNQWAVRAQLLWKPADSLSLLLRYSKSRQSPQNFGILADPVPAGIGSPAFTPGYYRTVDGTETGVPLANDQIAANYTARRKQDTQAWALTANWDATESLRLTSISSYDEGLFFSPEDSDGSPLSIIDTPTFGQTWQFTQDIRLTSDWKGPFNFILGAYYQRESLHNWTQLRIYELFDPAGSGDVCVTFGVACVYANALNQIRNSWATYADASYAINDQWKLRAGIRYTHDNGALRDFVAQVLAPNGMPLANLIPGDANNVNATLSHSLHNVAPTGKIGIDFTPMAGILAYASYNRGYRSGAFNAAAYFTPDEATIVKPETIDSVEVGLKTEWLNQRLQINGAMFRYVYLNQQVLSVDPLTAAQPLVNMGKSRTTGVEVELMARPTPSLRVNAGLVWLHARFVDAEVSGQRINGNQLPNAPNFSATLGADLDLWHWQNSELTVHADSNYQSSQFFEPGNDPFLRQGGYGTSNARVALRSTDDRWEVAAWGRNLGNRFYRTGGINLQAGFGFTYLHRNMPRTYGLDLTYRF